MTETLYERLGAQAGIESLVDRIVDLHLANPEVSTRFENGDMERSRAMAKEFFAAGSGGPVEYTGKSMLDAHLGMNVSEQELIAVDDNMMQAMNDLGYGQPKRDEVLAIAFSLKGEIIRV